MKIRKWHIAGLAASALMAGSGHSYEIGSGSVVKTTFDVHETLTALAMQCRDAQAGPTFDCRSYADKIAGTTQPRNRIAEEKGELNDLPYTVRWPDDPTRMLDQTSSKILFGAKMHDACSREVSGDARVDQAGLACSSHYGRLSFFHAMQVPQWPQADNERTRRLITQWADFAFRAATDKAFRDTDYCTAVAAAGPDLKTEMTFSDEKWCDQKRGGKQWKVRTLFALHCKSWVDTNRCWERINDFGDATAVAAAKGAILHLIQDSYSQAHVWRPTAEGWPAREKGPFAPIIACAPAKQFYRYSEQDGLMHDSADRAPQLDKSCFEPGHVIDDAITASATALYWLDKGDREAFAKYLGEHVFAG